MTEMMVREPEMAALTPYNPPPVGSTVARSLAEWETELLAAGSIATKLCNTPFVPSHFRGKPADAAAAILTGHELGLSPMASLRSIFMISGTPGMYAKTMVAVVQAAGHEVWPEEQSDDRVIVCGRRKGSERMYRTVWDRARVLQAGLQSNANYQTTPQQMLYARASSEICRQVAPDALLGIPYSVEELEDMRPARAELVVGERVSAAEILGTTPEPEPDSPIHPTVPGDDPAPVAGEPVPDIPPAAGITPGQLQKLHILLTEQQMTDRDKYLGVISMLVKHDVETTKDLTRNEARFVIDSLTQRARQAAAITDRTDRTDRTGPSDAADWPQVATPGEEEAT